MKSVFFGYSAKMALALLAAGAMTSCYEKEEVEKTPEKELPPAEYYIQGNVTSSETGEALPGASVAVNGAIQSLNGDGYFITDNLKNAGTYKVTASLADYYDAVKTVKLPPTEDGGVCIASADFAMAPVYVEPEPDPEPERPGLPDGEQMKDAVESATNTIAEALGMDAGELADYIEVDVENSKAVLTMPTEVETAVGESKTVTLPYFVGFSSTIDRDYMAPTKAAAATDGEAWLAQAQMALNIPYGMKNIGYTTTFPGLEGQSINGYKLTIMYQIQNFIFYGITGQVMYQAAWQAEPTYESHDNHNGHGSNPSAGGGTGK